jgi:hypothetical protein
MYATSFLFTRLFASINALHKQPKFKKQEVGDLNAGMITLYGIQNDKSGIKKKGGPNE